MSAHATSKTHAAGLRVFGGAVEEFLAHHSGTRFDLITSNHVLEHVPDPVTVLASMKELLAPGGTIRVAVPNADCPFSRRLRSRCIPPIYRSI